MINTIRDAALDVVPGGGIIKAVKMIKANAEPVKKKAIELYKNTKAKMKNLFSRVKSTKSSEASEKSMDVDTGDVSKK